MCSSAPYLHKGDLLVEKGTSFNILAHGDQLIVQSLTQMAMTDERLPSSERTVSRSPSPTPKSPVLTSTPKWDGTPISLNLQHNGDEGEKETEEELLVRVKRGKTVSQPSSSKRTRLLKRFPTKKIASSSKRRPGDLINEDVPEKSVDPSKSKPRFVPTSQTTKGPGTSFATEFS
ncbi:hypothetical protein HAX54_020074 [Datura stramonium]|uniref:Uncharacterized protein n=1 Tax=Datura stramonium TaxID=4076 RepID=A0ABS8UQB0_DATST|nr:hypothetical protein [Datura stramonium]